MYTKNFPLTEVMTHLKGIGYETLSIQKETPLKEDPRRIQVDCRTHCLNCQQSSVQKIFYSKPETIYFSETTRFRLNALYGEQQEYHCPVCQTQYKKLKDYTLLVKKDEALESFEISGLSFISDLDEDGLELLNNLKEKFPKKVEVPINALAIENLGYQILRYVLHLTVQTETLELVHAQSPLNSAYFYLGPNNEMAFSQDEAGTFRKIPKNHAFTDRLQTSTSYRRSAKEFIYFQAQEGATLLNRTGLRNYIEHIQSQPYLFGAEILKEIYCYERFRQDFPCVEQLAKCGYNTLLKKLIRNRHRKFYHETYAHQLLNPAATNPSRTFGYSKAVLKQLKTLGVFEDMDYALTMNELNQTSPIELGFLNELDDETCTLRYLYYAKDNLIELYRFGYSYVDSIRYAKRAWLTQAIPFTESLTLLRDYVRMARQMEIGYQQYPRSLKLEHDLMVRNYQYKADERLRQKFKEEAKKHKYLCYAPESEDYFITVPRDSEELVKEGHELSHCVASYVASVSKGETMILFLRKKENPEQPYITIEWRQHRVVQVRGFANAPLEKFPDAQVFFSKWKKHVDSLNEKLCS